MLNHQVLVLNFSYEPIGTRPLHKVMCKLARENSPYEVELLDGVRRFTTSGGKVYHAPSVVRLKHYVNIHKARTKSRSSRDTILRRDKYRCQYCGLKFAPKSKELTLDHILPKAQGGSSAPENLVTACQPCNGRKGNRTPEQARMPLLCSQTTLRAGLRHIDLCRYADANPKWRKYLYMDEIESETAESLSGELAFAV